MKNGLTYLIFVIDRSGSMESIRNDMIGGFNSFIRTQREAKLGECRVFAYKFDTAYDTMFEDIDLEQVPDLNRENYAPRGNTALYDSLGKTIIDIGAKLAHIPEDQRPSKVLVVTITDGEDNNHLGNLPREKWLDANKVKELVDHQTKNYKWDFAYIGANQDAWSVGGGMGVSNNLNYDATSKGTARAFVSLGSSTTKYRSCDAAFAFEPDDIDADNKKAVNPKKNATNKKTTT